MSEETFNVNQPPNAKARTLQFMDLSAEYLRVVPHRTKTPAYFTDTNPDALESLREGLLAHMLMRKFITKGESVYIPRVFDELLTDYSKEIPKPFAKEVRGFMQEASEGLKDVTNRGVQYGYNSDDMVPEKVILNNYLNGRLLHSDHGKWENANSETFRVMLGAWLHVRAKFRRYLNASRHNVRLTVTEHSLFSIPRDNPELD
ncbi:hypothetical protein M3694_01445 [Kocuria marina]|uniref:hypothetical protein n=1 Tax=Kocuria marina TaxID=223184 RepID=UPI002989C858|nr:hypothetical protein [Kocuria marina]MCT2360432.1 hypothetical protein [Kocuria marina]